MAAGSVPTEMKTATPARRQTRIPHGLTPVLVLLVFTAACYLRMQSFLQPWIGGHNAWGGAMYGNIARNYLIYGYGTTLLGPVANTGPVTPAEFEFYYHYPPLQVLLVSLSYQVFGVHEWSARLVSLLFSLLSMGVVYAFARRAFAAPAAPLALLFLAVMPIENFYGAHVDVYGSQAVFFTLLAVYGYYRWLGSGNPADLALCIAGVTLGCLTAWFTYFAIPLMLAHYHFVHSKTLRWSPLWITVFCAVAVVGAFLLHRHVLQIGDRPEVHGSLLGKFLLRLSAQSPEGQGGFVAALMLQFRHVVHLYTVPLAGLALGWVVLFLHDWRRTRLPLAADWCVLILLGYGLLHSLVFPSFTYGHDYMVVSYVPGIALAAALVVSRAYRWMEQRWRPMIAMGLLAVAVVIIVVPSLRETQRLLATEDRAYGQQLLRWGRWIGQNTQTADVLLMPDKDDRIFLYYADRKTVFQTDTPEKLAAVMENGARSYYFVCSQPQAKRHQELIAYLEGRYPKQSGEGLLVFALSKRAN